MALMSQKTADSFEKLVAADEADNYDYQELIESMGDIDRLDDLSDEEDQAVFNIMTNSRIYIENILKIQDKRGDLVPFIFNKPQQKLHYELERQRALGIPQRIIILKARQIGFSTAVAGEYYYRSVVNENTNSGIIAHKADASSNIFKKMNLFYEESPLAFQPMKKAKNAKVLLFENPSTNNNEKQMNPGLRSQIILGTALDTSAFRSATIHNLHMSEVAFWKPNAEETAISALQAVPNTPDTAVIIESTANGVGGWFYEQWVRAIKGESEFVPLFFPWYEYDKYVAVVPNDFQITEEEKELKQKYDLTDEQICWRRWCISTNCGGDINKFHQEYPAEWHEAFLASGRPVFDVDKLDMAIRNAKEPEFVGRVVQDGKNIRFRTEFNGRLKIWEKPQKDIKYIIGVDSSSGDREGDPACMAVYRGDTKTQVAEWHGFMPPDLLGEEAVYLAKYYNDAFIAPEQNNHGVSVIDSIKRLRYWKLFRRSKSPENRNEDITEKYGFWTSQQSKKTLIDNFAKYIRENADKIKSKDALNECVTYVYDDQNRSNAQHGCHDDRVIANALAVYGIHLNRGSFKKTYFRPIDLKEAYGISDITGY